MVSKSVLVSSQKGADSREPAPSSVPCAGTVLDLLFGVKRTQVSYPVDRFPTCTTHTTSSPLSIV